MAWMLYFMTSLWWLQWNLLIRTLKYKDTWIGPEEVGHAAYFNSIFYLEFRVSSIAVIAVIQNQQALEFIGARQIFLDSASCKFQENVLGFEELL